MTCPHCNHDLTPDEVLRLNQQRVRAKAGRKLTLDQIAEIQRLKSRYTSEDLAKRYGVGASYIRRVW